MNFKTPLIYLIVLMGLQAGLFAKENVVINPVSFGMFMEYGQIVHGWEYAETGDEIRGEVEQRTGIFIMQRATFHQKLKLNIGVGGLFFYVPQSQGLEHTIGAKFGPGIAETNLIYHFGNPDEGNAWLKAGYWPMKYNPNATNLGEYLYRSGTYPGFLRTGSWATLNSAFYYAQGLQFHLELLDGMLVQDFTLFMEREYYPNHDLTPTYLATLNAGPLSLGTGASFHHLIAMKPSLLEPRHEESTYLTFSNFPAASPVIDNNGQQVLDSVDAGSRVEGLASGLLKYETADPLDPAQTINVVDARYWQDNAGLVPGQLMESQVDKIERMFCSVADPNSCLAEEQIPAGEEAAYLKTSQNRFTATENYVYPREEYRYTHRGIKLMFMSSLDFSFLLGLEDMMSPRDLHLFIEAAVLGVKNQPFFYDDITERIPIMFGFNLPTFKFVDIFSVQLEYYNSPWDNNISSYYQSSLPVPSLPGGTPWAEQITADDDNWQWSVFASKKWMNSVTVFAQVANDHLRTFHPDFVRPVVGTVLPNSKDWYWMLRLDVNI